MTLPVTVAATRRAGPGRGDELHRWAMALCATAATFSGRLESDVRQRSFEGAVHVTVSLTFATAAAASAWESSRQRKELLEQGDVLADGVTVAVPVPPDLPQQPRWRTALVVWAGLFPFALVLNIVAGPLLAGMPVLARTLLTTAVLVPLAVYAGIPAVHHLIALRPRRRVAVDRTR